MSQSRIYAQRRARVAAQLGKDGIALIPTAPERPRNRDSDFLYRHDSYFYYLTGFHRAQRLAGDHRRRQEHAVLRAQGPGARDLGRLPAGPRSRAGGAGRRRRAFSVDELDAQLPKLLENRDAVWYPFAIHEGLEARVGGWLNQVRARVRYGALCPEQQRDLCAMLDEMRLVKDAHEQDIMRRAAADQRPRPTCAR